MICLLVRDFAPTQERKLNQTLGDAPLILVEAGRYRPKVIAPDAEARQMGVHPQMWLGEAVALCPQGQLLPVDEQRYRRLFVQITEKLLQITDRIEAEYQATSAAWYTDDTLMLSYLCAAIQQETGIAPQIGQANPKFPARVAAAMTPPSTLCEIPPDTEAEFLNDYPITLLPLDKLMKRRLPLLGISTLGQLAQLPRIAVWEQFGKHGRWLHDLANGVDIRPLAPYKPAPSLTKTTIFDDGITNRQTLHQHLSEHSLHLIEHLNGCEAQHLTLILTQENGHILEHHRYPPQAIRDNLYLLRLLTQMLDSQPISDAITELEVQLSDIQERLPVQLSLFESNQAVVQLSELAPEWARRHHYADFYHLTVHEQTFLPEEHVEHQRVSGA